MRDYDAVERSGSPMHAFGDLLRQAGFTGVERLLDRYFQPVLVATKPESQGLRVLAEGAEGSLTALRGGP